jgi:hypothetical protein
MRQKTNIQSIEENSLDISLVTEGTGSEVTLISSES